MNNSSIKMGLAIGITTLFIISTVTPMTIGFNSRDSDDNELELMFDNLRYVCTTPIGFNETRYEYYKEQLLKQYSDENLDDFEVVEDIEPMVYEEQQVISPMSGGPMDSPWPMKCHDIHHTSLSPYSTADNPYDEIWRFGCDQVEEGSVIDSDGVIYFGDFDGYLYALYPNNGTLKWKYNIGGWIWSTPAISEDGTIYIGANTKHLHAVNPDGTRKWAFNAQGTIWSSPAIDADGTIYFGTMRDMDKGDIFAVYPNGTEKWRYQTGYYITSDPAIGNDGTVYIGSGDTYLYAMNPNGTLKWRFKTGDWIKAHPSINEDGIVYISSFDGRLYAIYPNNGTMKWKRSNGYNGCSSVAIGEDGTLYFGSLIAAYPNNGTTKWMIDIPNIDHSSLAISADGTIYAGASNYIIAIDSNNGTEKWRKNIANYWVESSPSIAEDGTVYIGSSFMSGGSSYGYFYAFGRKELEADANGPYYGLTNQPIEFTGSSSGGYSPHSYFWDFGDTYTSEEQNPTHSYSNPGNYTVIFTVTDNKSNTVTDTTYAWIQNTNTQPDKPTINGPTRGAAGTTYEYKFTATDPDNSIVYLYVDLGDNTNSGWIGPYNNGQQVTLSHSWSEQDTYTIKAKAKDPYDAEGSWGTLDVTMPKNKMMLHNSLLVRLIERFPILERLLLFIK